MIVNYTQHGWQVISQRSHGLLAAQICAQWKLSKQPGRWVETLIATAEHDDVFNEFDNPALLDANGAPLNFKETTFEHDKAQQLIDLAQTKSAYIALLISRHIQFVHGPDPSAAPFIKTLKTSEKNWLKTCGATKNEIDQSYELLEFCDALSLLLCQKLIQPEGRKIEISNGPDQRHYEMFQKNDQLIISPWPFEITSFTISYESRTVPQLTFSDTEEFRNALINTKTITHHWTLAKS